MRDKQREKMPRDLIARGVALPHPAAVSISVHACVTFRGIDPATRVGRAYGCMTNNQRSTVMVCCHATVFIICLLCLSFHNFNFAADGMRPHAMDAMDAATFRGLGACNAYHTHAMCITRALNKSSVHCWQGMHSAHGLPAGQMPESPDPCTSPHLTAERAMNPCVPIQHHTHVTCHTLQVIGNILPWGTDNVGKKRGGN